MNNTEMNSELLTMTQMRHEAYFRYLAKQQSAMVRVIVAPADLPVLSNYLAEHQSATVPNTVIPTDLPLLSRALPPRPSVLDAVQFKASPLPTMALLRDRIEASYQAAAIDMVPIEEVAFPPEPQSPVFAPILFDDDEEVVVLSKPTELIEICPYRPEYEPAEEFEDTDGFKLIANRFAYLAGALLQSCARRIRSSFSAKEAPSAEFLEEITRLSCLLEAEYDGCNFKSSVCPPLTATQWNIIAMIPESKASPEASPSQAPIQPSKAKTYLATIGHGIIGLFHSSCKLMKSMMPRTQQPEFEMETSRLACLLDSLDYCGEAFVSAVCPPLSPNQWNIVTVIGKPQQEKPKDSTLRRSMDKIVSLVSENFSILLSLSATALAVFA